MKKKEFTEIIFERGDYVEQPQGFFIYLGNNLWLNRSSHTLYKGSNRCLFPKGCFPRLNLFYICEGDIVNHLLKGIPEQNDCYVKQ